MVERGALAAELLESKPDRAAVAGLARNRDGWDAGQTALTAPISPMIDALASPNSIVVFGS